MTTPDPFSAPEPGAGAPQDPSAPPPAYGQQPTWPSSNYGYGPAPHGYGPPPAAGSLPLPQGFQVPPQTDGTAIAVLVLAICSFVVFPVVPAIVALVLAPSAERDIAAAGGRLTGEGLVRAGRVVAWIHLALCAVAVVGVIALLGVFSTAGFS
jgi:hypothetical protein